MAETEEQASLDPFRLWREWFQENEKRWNDQLTELLGDERFAKGLGRSFQEILHVHRMFTESMGQYLANLNVPARSDVLALTDRVGELEDAVAGLQVEIRQLRGAIEAGSVGETPKRPSRTRQPEDS